VFVPAYPEIPEGELSRMIDALARLDLAQAT
jgi:hypothetical protein